MLVAKDFRELVNASENEHHRMGVQVCTWPHLGRSVAPSTCGGGFKQHGQTEQQPSSDGRVHTTHPEHEGDRR
jgi:hypothetical protein